MSAYSDTLCRVPQPQLWSAEYWTVVGEFIENETNRQRLTLDALAKQAGLSRQTVSKLVNGEPLQVTSLARIEGALGLPRDLLAYIALGDWHSISDATDDRDMYRWLTRKIGEARRSMETLAAVADEGEKDAHHPEPHAE